MEKIDKLRTFLQVSPDDPFLKHALALEYIKIGEEEPARQLFLEIVIRDPLYIGTYYHLAALLERTGDREAALGWYEKGMAVAKQQGDQHAFNELQAAYGNLI